VKSVLSNFNLLATTMRGSERQVCYELAYLLKEIGDPTPEVGKTGVRGVIVGKTALDPVDTIGKFRGILQKRPYEFRYALRILPIEKVVRTDLGEVKRMAMELAAKIGENETFRVTVEKRFTSIHSRDLIEAAAMDIQRKADMENPDKILLIEVIGGVTGMALIKPSDILTVVKEKML
jgi:tRNA acetyltransferase TAN1